MTPLPAGTISKVNFDKAFTGNGKIFVKVEKHGHSEHLVIYEKSGFAAFVADLFRNRADTLTLREWAHRKLGDLPQTFDKERLTQNIKQLQQGAELEAPALINKLIADRKLDADPKIVSNFIKNTPLVRQAFRSKIENALPKISDQLGLTTTQFTNKGEIKTTYFDKELWKRCESRISAQIPTNLKAILVNLINSDSAIGTAMVRATSLSFFMSDGATAKALGNTPVAFLKPFAEFLLKLDSDQTPDDLQHQRYLTTLKLAIQKLDAIEFEQNRPKT